MMRRLIGSILVAGLVLGGCTSARRADMPKVAVPARSGEPRATAKATAQAPEIREVRLSAFGSCDALLAHVKREATKIVQPWGLQGLGYGGHGGPFMTLAQSADGGTSAPADASPASVPMPAAGVGAYSTTNVQEVGVDEPDTVKTDGSRVVSINGERLYLMRLEDGAPRLTDVLELPGADGRLLLQRDRVVVIARSWTPDVRAPWTGGDKTTVHVVQIDGDALKLASTLSVEGSFVDARMTGGVARLVVRSQPAGLRFVVPQRPGAAAERRARAANRRVIASSRLENWVPDIEVRTPGKGVRRGRAADCAGTFRPRAHSGFGMVTVLSIDPDAPSTDGAVSVLADADTVYANHRSLYVTTTRWIESRTPDVIARESTQIHRFDISDARETVYRSSGSISGRVLNQWSLSEHEGVLRVATTRGWGEDSVSGITVLEERARSLVRIGSVGGLGKTERIYAVRFMQDVAYVVTFRQIDPLYTVDLSDPVKPRVLGELKIPGYSAYLHPIGDGLLIGVGKDATDEGGVTGLAVSLFDVADLSAPKRLHHRTIEDAASSVEFDHHAFSWWPATNMLVVPVRRWSSRAEDAFGGAMVYRVGRSGIEERGSIEHPSYDDRSSWQAAVDRTLVAGGRLFSRSPVGMMTHALDDLARKEWIPWTPTFGHVSTLAKDAGVIAPAQVAPGRDGTLFVADGGNRRIVWFERDRRKPTVVALRDPLPSAPSGLTVARDGSLVVATSCALWRIASPRAAEPALERIAGPPTASLGCRSTDGAPADGAGADARFGSIAQIVIDDRDGVVVADRGAHAIRRVDLDTGVVTTIAGTLAASGYRDGAARDARFASPSGVVIFPDGDVLVADTENHVVRRIDVAGRVVGTVAGAPGAAGEDRRHLTRPSGIAYDEISRTLLVTELAGASGGGNRVRSVRGRTIGVVAGSGTAGARDGQPRIAQLSSPASVALWNGQVVVADTGNDSLRMVYRNNEYDWCC